MASKTIWHRRRWPFYSMYRPLIRSRLRKTRCGQRGFSLVEVAIVLVLVALLMAGFLKGQELIHSSRVKKLAETSTGIRTAYLAFIDRYKKIPGDWDADSASNGIGVTINNPASSIATVDNGRLDNPSGANAYAEPNALWEQLAKSKFINGSYSGANAEPTSGNGLTPLNVFGAPIIVGNTSEFQDPASPPVMLHVYTGRFVPVSAMRELDVKIDDGFPLSGSLRATESTATIFTGGPSGWGGMDPTCVDSAPVPNWNVAASSADCNAVLMF